MTVLDKKSFSAKFLEKLMGEKLTFSSLLHSIRLGEELTQTEFANILGISKQYLCDIEKGRRFVSPKTAVEFAEILGLSEAQFVRLCLQDILTAKTFIL